MDMIAIIMALVHTLIVYVLKAVINSSQGLSPKVFFLLYESRNSLLYSLTFFATSFFYASVAPSDGASGSSSAFGYLSVASISLPEFEVLGGLGVMVGGSRVGVLEERVIRGACWRDDAGLLSGVDAGAGGDGREAGEDACVGNDRLYGGGAGAWSSLVAASRHAISSVVRLAVVVSGNGRAR